MAIQRPPRSTLFPTRRSSDLAEQIDLRRGGVGDPQPEIAVVLLETADHVRGPRVLRFQEGRRRRSEEHTYVLQSRFELVLRHLPLIPKECRIIRTIHSPAANV